MKEYKITYHIFGEITIEAENQEEAMDKARMTSEKVLIHNLISGDIEIKRAEEI